MPVLINYNYGEAGYGFGPYGGGEVFTNNGRSITTSFQQSTLLQLLLNYFDEKDVRIRENLVSIGAQLLNAAAIQIEEMNRTIRLEEGAFNMSKVPLNIDHAGVYHAAKIPLSFNLPIINGILNPPSIVVGDSIFLAPYFDELPIPNNIVLDTTGNSMTLETPIICNVTGTGATIVVNNPEIIIPNKLTFSIVGMGPTTGTISIRVVGELNPPAVWYQDVQSRTETLTITTDGLYTTDMIWSSVASITINGLPLASTLQCYSIQFNLPAVPDLDRPYTHYAYRDILYPRFWQLSGLLLQETYKRSSFTDFEPVNTYLLPNAMLDVAVEPNTFGLFLTDGSNLYYIDRRTPLPSTLEETGLVQEPLYGLNAWYDGSKSGANKWVQVYPVPGSKANQCVQYRYTVEDPNDNVFILNQDGSFSTYKDGLGWIQGFPIPISFPTTIDGTYTITLELLDQQNLRTYDVYPYNNLAISSLFSINLTSLVPNIQGIAFDAYGKLWIWTGAFAIPLKIVYDAYVFDPDTRTLFLTDSYSEVQIA